jgi:agrin
MDCANDYKPVCGTDGVTYINICKLRRESCLRQELIEISYEDSCDLCKNVVCPNYSICVKDSNGFGTSCVCSTTTCKTDLRPVCGSDGETYQSICHLQLHSCQIKTPITLKHDGNCDLPNQNHIYSKDELTCDKCKYNSNCAYIDNKLQCTCDHFVCDNFPQ